MKCKRCLNTNRFLFAKIYCYECESCYYCLKCAHISIFKICEDLENQLEFTRKNVTYNLNYNLTKKQECISNEICNNIETNNIFVNAACGAGKTEIVFEVIKQYINKHRNVCFVCPRVEVINQLYLRFNNAFNEKFGIITGNTKEYEGSMFFLTVNQLINYHNLFDLIIVDECDAFPLKGDKVLENGIELALNEYGRIIKMSATPLKIDKSYLELNLDERYHKEPIPTPYYIEQSIDKLKEIISRKSWIVFFPTIKILEEVAKNFENIVICHSKIDDITEKLDRLPNDFIIFSTAILERGITLANVNVIVYECDHNNYNFSVLVQMSGRVGRVVPYTKGEVIFMGKKQTMSTRKSIKHINKLND